MKTDFLNILYEAVFQTFDNVCRSDWENALCDNSIYKDYKEYREVKFRETLLLFNQIARDKGHIL